MKVKNLTSKHWTTLVSLILGIGLLVWIISLAIRQECNMKSRTLNYVIKKKLESINLDLWEAEAYYNAIIVQSLIGNLVYHSNHGRYEPRLAEKWSRVSPTRWEFTLREGMTCENGERITTESFKRSIERSILAGLVNGEPPVLNKLVGYREFVKERNSLLGIQAIGNILAFDFTSPVRDGVVQTLSYAPYGYICADNMNPDGKWKDPYKFISSGPYKVAEIQKGKLYVLEMRHEWEGISHPKSPRKIRITDIIPHSLAESSHFILDFYEAPKNTPKSVQVYKLVPEYLVAVFFGNLETGFFGRKENREKFKRLMERNRDLMPLSFFGYQTRADSFFAVASTKNLPIISATMSDFKYEMQERPLIIEGTEPPETSARITGWKILKKSLEEANLKYEFAGIE
jgi:hypothetical protein